MDIRAFVWVGLFLILGITVWYWHSKIRMHNAGQEPLVIFTFLGAPGSGKGTLAENCVKDLHFQMLSTGNVIREHISKNTEFGKKLQSFTNAGLLVPDEIVIDMVKDWINNHANIHHPIILDGFPRTEAQAEALMTFLQQTYPNHLLRIVELRISDDAVVQRLSTRVMCTNKACQAIYNMQLMGGQILEKCTKCGSQLGVREDDREEVVRTRLAEYAKTRDQLINYYKSKGLNIQEIDVETKQPQDVFAAFKEISTKI